MMDENHHRSHPTVGIHNRSLQPEGSPRSLWMTGRFPAEAA